MRKIIAVVVVVLAGLGGVAYWRWQEHAGTQTTYRYDEAKRGRLVATITSTGTLQPRELVDVGAQVAGRIVFIGKDSNTRSGYVDWGSEVEGSVVDEKGNVVKQGTILAQIDDQLYRAQLNSAEAALKVSQADLEQKKATLGQVTADWNRAQKLFESKGIAQAEYDQYRAQFNVATANVEASKAQIGVAQANMKTAQTNLNYTTITSPVNGVVIDRRVNMGQTVVASLSAPSLFLIAKDLSKLEVWATVNEVDVGKIKAGQRVKFTVDALPGRAYSGEVVPQGKLPFRLNATMTQNVVTYTVVVSADNSDGMLRPYWTTNLAFIVEDKSNALLVPNAALRWQPAPAQIAPEARETYSRLRGRKRSATDTDGQDHGFIWVKAENGLVNYLEILTGASDMVNTEVVGVVGGGELLEHTPIIVGEGKAGGQAADNTNPFSVQMFRQKPKDQ